MIATEDNSKKSDQTPIAQRRIKTRGRPATGPTIKDDNGHSRRLLTDEEKEEAKRLRKVWDKYRKDQKSKGRPITQKEAALRVGLRTQAAFSQYINGSIPLNTEMLFSFCEFLGIPPNIIRPSLSNMKSLGLTPFTNDYAADALENGSISMEDLNSLTGDSAPFLMPCYLKQVEITPGQGDYRVVETKITPAELFQMPTGLMPKAILKQKNLTLDQIKCVTISDNSMAPVLKEGATVAINTESLQIVNGRLYAIDYKGYLQIRLLYDTPQGIRIKVYNEAEFSSDIVESGHRKLVKVLGQVFWASSFL